MYKKELKHKLSNEKRPRMIDSAKNPPDRMPIANHGIVQLVLYTILFSYNTDR
jgi:hypothetical protein